MRGYPICKSGIFDYTLKYSTSGLILLETKIQVNPTSEVQFLVSVPQQKETFNPLTRGSFLLPF